MDFHFHRLLSGILVTIRGLFLIAPPNILTIIAGKMAIITNVIKESTLSPLFCPTGRRFWFVSSIMAANES